MKYLLDSNICIYLIRRKSKALIERLASHSTTDLAVSQITVAELRFGAEKSSAPKQNHQALEEFLLPLQVLDFDGPAATTYGIVRRKLEADGTPIGPLDNLIAAHAISQDLTLVTQNVKEFKRVPGLKVEDWTRA
jgi:tRNA(fMet)-specific endonuclease VapC